MVRILVVSDIHGSGWGALAIKRMAAEHSPDVSIQRNEGENDLVIG